MVSMGGLSGTGSWCVLFRLPWMLSRGAPFIQGWFKGLMDLAANQALDVVLD
jgi:hypothetical protein